MEISRPSSASPAEDLAKLAQQYVACGADALAVRIDAEDTPEGLKDLYVVCQSVKVPVLARDWVIHPLQVRGWGRGWCCCWQGVLPVCAAGLLPCCGDDAVGWRSSMLWVGVCTRACGPLLAASEASQGSACAAACPSSWHMRALDEGMLQPELLTPQHNAHLPPSAPLACHGSTPGHVPTWTPWPAAAQVVEAKEAGAAGIIGIVHQVNGRGTPVMSSFAAALGLDAPVEVVNLQEVELMARSGVVFYGINLGVGLSISVPGFASQMAHGLLGQMPFGAISLVGVRTFDEASRARASGADALLVKKEMVEVCQQQGMDVQSLISRLQYAVGGDD